MNNDEIRDAFGMGQYSVWQDLEEHDVINAEEFRKRWEYLKEQRTAEHFGDCIKQANTCFRCMIDDFDRVTNAIFPLENT